MWLALQYGVDDWLLLAGIAGLGLGMMLTLAGIIMAALFLPGVAVLALAHLALALAGLLRLRVA
jgi:hypothetical protein